MTNKETTIKSNSYNFFASLISVGFFLFGSLFLLGGEEIEKNKATVSSVSALNYPYYPLPTPVPLKLPIDLPINWQDSASINYTVTDFEGTVSSLAQDPTNSANTVLQTVKLDTAEFFAGTTFNGIGGSLANPIPFNVDSTTIKVLVYSPDAGIAVRLKAEDHTNPNIYVELDDTISVANTWDTLEFNFFYATGQTLDFANTYDMLSIFYNFGVEGAIAGTKAYFVDSIWIAASNNPIVAPTSKPNLPITWDDSAAMNYSIIDFGGITSILDTDPINSFNTVLKSDKSSFSQTWAGVTIGAAGLENPIPFQTGSTTLSALVYSPKVGAPVRLKVEDQSNASIFIEVEDTTTKSNAWDTLVFDFSNSLTQTINFSNTYDLISIFYDFGSIPTSIETYYLDDLVFGEFPAPSPPTNTSNARDTTITINENTTADTIFNFNTNGLSGYSYTLLIGDSQNFKIEANQLIVTDYAYLDADADSNTFQLQCIGTNGSLFDTINIVVQLNDLIEPVYAGFGSAYQFDGVDDFVEFNRDGLPGNIDPKTISLWVKRTSNFTNRRETLIKFGEAYSDIVINTTSEELWFYIGTNSIFTSNRTIPSNRWTFVTYTFDGATAKVYINGELDYSYTNNNVGNNSNEFNLTIGKDPQGLRDHFTGSLDEVTVWDKALSQSEILYLYENGPFTNQIDLVSYVNFNEIDNNLVVSNSTTGQLDTISNGSLSSIVNGPGINNNASVTLNKTFTTNDTLGYLNAYDPDRSTRSYALVSGGLNAFSIAPSGLVKIANQTVFDTLSNTSYDIFYSVTENGDNQVDTGFFTINFTSFLGPKSLPFYQNFEGDSNYVNLTGDNGNWLRITGASPSFYGGASGAYEGSQYFYLPQDFNEDSAAFELPYLDFSTASSPYLSFKYHVFNDYEPNRLFIQVERDNSGNWITVFDTIAQFADIWNTANIDLSNFASANLLKIRFIASNRDNYNEIAIDDIVVYDPFSIDVAAFGMFNDDCFAEQTIRVIGEIKNQGLTTLNSVDYSFYVNDSLFQSNTLSSINIAPQASYLILLGVFPKTEDYIFNFSTSTPSDGASFNDSLTVAFNHQFASLVNSNSFKDSIELSFDLVDTNLNWAVRVTSPTQSFIPVGSSGMAYISGVAQNTGYDIELVELCGSDTIVALSTTVFSVCEYVTIPYKESFESTTCYEILGGTVWENYWYVESGDASHFSGAGPSFAQDGQNYMHIDPWGGSNDAIFQTAYLDLRNTSNVEFSFYYLLNISWIGGLTVEIDTTNSNNWQQVFFKDGDQGNAWKRFSYDIPSQFLTDSVRFRFIATPDNSSIGPAVDNIQVKTKATNDVSSLLLSEGDCYTGNTTPFKLRAQNNGTSAFTGFTASVFGSDSVLIETVSDYISVIGPDSIFEIDFSSPYSKTNQVYFSNVSISGDSIDSDNISHFNYEPESPDLLDYVGSVELTLNYDVPGLIAHNWLVSLVDSGITNYAFLDSLNTAYIDGLAQETNYFISINEVCGTDTNFLVSDFATTTCSYKPIPYFQDFSDVEGCFEAIPGDFSWFVSSFSSDFASATLASFDGPAGDTAFLNLPYLNATLEPNPVVYFDYALSSVDPVNLLIQVDSNNLNNWTTIASITQGTGLNWADTSISLNGFTSDSTRIRFGAVKVAAGSNSRRDYYKLDNVEVFGSQPIDYNFIGFQFGDSCAYQDSLNSYIIFNNAGTLDLNSVSINIEEGGSQTSSLTSSVLNYSQPILVGDTVKIPLGNLKFGRFIRAYFNDTSDIVTNNNAIESNIENEFGTFKKSVSNGSVDLGFVISTLSSDSLQLAIAEESYNNQEDLFQFSSMIRDFNSSDSSIVFSNLNAGFNYKIQVREFCYGNYSDFSLDFDNINNTRLGFKMDCADTLTFGFFETFDYESASFNNRGCFLTSTASLSHQRWNTEDRIWSSFYGPSIPPSKPNFLAGQSSSSYAGDTMVVLTPYLNLTTNQTPVISFNYHLYGNDVVNLIVQADTGNGWKNLFAVTGNQGPDWKFQSLYLPSFQNKVVQLRFLSEIPLTGNQFQVEPAIDNFSIDSASAIEVVLEENIPPFVDLLSLDYLVSTTVSSPIIFNPNNGPFGMASSQPGGNTQFTIISGNNKNSFRIDSTTNVLQTNRAINLDEESGTSYNLTIAYSQNGNNDTLPIIFTIQDSPEPVYAGRGSAIRIESDDQFVYNGKIVPDGTEQTVAFWMKNKSKPFGPEMINFGSFRLDYNSKSAQFNGIGSIGEIIDTGWVHIAQTFSNTNTILYINGRAIDTAISVSNSYSTNFIGTAIGTQNTTEGFLFDDFMLWKQPFTNEKVNNLMAGNFNLEDTNLVAYYDMNYVPNSTTLIDRTVNGFDMEGQNQTYIELENSVDTIIVYVENTALANDSISKYINYDPDSNAISFASFQDTSGNFELDTTNQTIRLAPSANLSNIQFGDFAFAYSIQESGDNSIGSVNYLVKITSTPQVVNQNILLNENIPNGDTIANMAIINPDSTKQYRYLIVGGNIGNSFAIDSLSADVYVTSNDSIDAEKYTFIDLSIAAYSTDSTFFDTAVLNISINDIIEPLYAGYANALILDGVDDYVEVNEQVIPSTGNFTLSLWAKQNAPQTSEVILVSQNSQFTATNKRFYFGATATGAIRIGDDWSTTGANFPTDLNWHHYTIVRSTNNIELYVDGIEVAEKGSNYDNPNLSPFRIGRQFGNNTNYFDGIIDEIKVFDYALTGEELQIEIGNFPADTLSAMRSYFNFDQENLDSLNNNAPNNWKGSFLNYASQNYFTSSYDTVVLYIPENRPQNDTLFKLQVSDPDNSPIQTNWFFGDSSIFSFDSASLGIMLVDSSKFDFETDSIFRLGFGITELGDNQIDTTFYKIQLINQPDPYDADISLSKEFPLYNHLPKSQYNGIGVRVTNNGPLNFTSLSVVSEIAILADTITLDSLKAGADTVLVFQFPNLSNNLGLKQLNTYFATDTFDTNPTNDSLNINLVITDSLFAKALIPDTLQPPIYLESGFSSSTVGVNEKVGLAFDLSAQDTLTGISFSLQSISASDTFSVELWSFTSLPDSLIETQNISFSDTSSGFKYVPVNCFNLLDSGRYFVSLSKVNASGSEARIQTTNQNFDSTASWVYDSLGSWALADQQIGFSTHPLISLSLGSFSYPTVLTNNADTILICPVNDSTLLGSTLNGNYTWTSPYGITNDSTLFAADSGNYMIEVLTGNNCTFKDSIYVENFILPIFSLGVDTAICDQDSLTLKVGPSFNVVSWSNGTFGDSTSYSTPGIASVIVLESNGCLIYDSLSLTIDTLPLVVFDSLPEICGNEADLVIPSQNYLPAGGTFSSFSIQLNFDTVLVNATAEGVTDDIVYTFTDANGCTSADTLQVSIKEFPKPIAPVLPDFCNNEVPQVLPTGIPSYGYYRGAGIIQDSLLVPDSLTAGTFQLKYIADSTNGCSDSVFTSLTINPNPIVDSINLEGICENEGLVVLSGGFPAGGIFGRSLVQNDTLNPSILPLGNNPISYTLENTFGCQDSLIDSVMILPKPTLTFNALPAICNNDSSLNLTGFVSDTNLAYFSYLGDTSFFFNPNLADTGLNKVTYIKETALGCADSLIEFIDVLASPEIQQASSAKFCVYDTINLINFAGITPFIGFFRGNGILSDSLTYFRPSDSLRIDSTTYFVNFTNGCSDSLMIPIQLDTVPKLTFTLTQNRVCKDAPNLTLSGANIPNGNYSGPDSAISKAGNTTFFYPQNTNLNKYPVTYSFTDNNGCLAQVTDSILVDTLPKPTISTIPSFCAFGDTLQLNGYGSHGALGVFSGDAVLVDSLSSTYYFDPDSANINPNNQINYSVTDSFGCVGDTFQLVTVNPLPQFNFNPLGPYCVDDQTDTITQTVPNSIVTFKGSGVGFDTTSNQYFFDPDPSVALLNTVYMIVQNNVTSCIDSSAQQVLVDTIPLVSLSLSAIDTLCFGGLPVSMGGGSPLGGTYSVINAPSLLQSGQYFTNNGNVGRDTVVYSYTNPQGCLNTDTAFIDITPLPQLTFSLPTTSLCNKDAAFALSGGTAVSGNIAQTYYTGASVVNNVFDPNPLFPGLYDVYFVGEDSLGCIDSVSQIIEVKPQPAINFPVVSNICLNEDSVPITAATTGALSWNYSLITSSTNTIHPDSGFFSANLVTTDTIKFVLTDTSFCSDSVLRAITVDSLPTVSFSLPPVSCKNSPTAIILNTGIPSGGVYTFNDSALVSSVSPSVFAPGINEVVYKAFDANGCFGTDTQSIQINVPDSITLSTLPILCSNGSPVVLNQGWPSSGTYSAPLGMVNDSVFDPSSVFADSMLVTFSYTNSLGCDSSISSYLYMVPPAPVVYNPPLPTLCIDEDTVDLRNNLSLPLSNFSSFFFSGPGIVDSTGQFLASQAGEGGKDIEFNYTDTNACANSITSQLIVRSLPQPILTQSEEQICLGDSAVLSVLNGQVDILWETGDSVSVIEVRPDSAKWFEVTLIDFYGCVNTDSILQDVYNSFFVEAELDSVSTELNTPIDIFPLDNDKGNITIVSLIQGPNNGSFNEDFNPELTYTPNAGFRRIDSAYYEMCDDFCPTVCDTGLIKMKVFGNPNDFIPEGFSPDGDGINDWWFIPGIDLYPQNKVVIFNRWGNKVFEAAPYRNNETEAWRAQANGFLSYGNQIPDGTYFYIITLDEGLEPISGSVEVKRQQ